MSDEVRIAVYKARLAHDYYRKAMSTSDYSVIRDRAREYSLACDELRKLTKWSQTKINQVVIDRIEWEQKWQEKWA